MGNLRVELYFCKKKKGGEGEFLCRNAEKQSGAEKKKVCIETRRTGMLYTHDHRRTVREHDTGTPALANY